ncbi:MAG: ArnT family glycosyltransferase [Flavisolibacter sp.]
MKRNTFILLLLAIVKLLMPLLLHHHEFELHRDEYLYYQQGQHWDLGFLENPPMIGILGSLSYMLGGSFFWIRLWPALFGALTLVVTTGIVKELGGKFFAQVIAALGILFSAYMRIHFLFQPNFLDIFFWTLSAYYLLRYINSNERSYLFLLATSTALGWWSKYSILFFVSALIISIFLTYHRKIMKKKDFWFAVLCGFLMVIPNIYWQWQHKWPLLHHMHELKETQLKYLNKTDFLKEQILMLLPVFFVWIGGLIWLLMQKKFRIIGYMFLLVIIFVMLGSGKGYYTLGAYPMVIAAGGVWIELNTRYNKGIRIAIVIFILTLSIPLIPLLLPLSSPTQMADLNKKWHLDKAGLLMWEDRKSHPLQQDFADMLGWKEMTYKAERLFELLPDSTKANTVIYCRNYGEAGALKYYGTDDYFRLKVICDNGTFLLWIPDRMWFSNLIFIGSDIPGTDDEVFQHFSKVTVIDSVSNTFAREHGTKIIFFQNGSDSALKRASQGIRDMKREFGE